MIFGIIGCLVLALIFFIMRVQSTHAELGIARAELKALHKHTKFSLSTVMLMSKHLTNNYRAKLEAARRHGLLYGDDLTVVQFLVENLEHVVMQCCEKHATVEEALKDALESFTLEMTTIQQFIARQPVSVRVPWSKNTLDGYLAACNHLLMDKVKVAEQADETSQ